MQTLHELLARTYRVSFMHEFEGGSRDFAVSLIPLKDDGSDDNWRLKGIFPSTTDAVVGARGKFSTLILESAVSTHYTDKTGNEVPFKFPTGTFKGEGTTFVATDFVEFNGAASTESTAAYRAAIAARNAKRRENNAAF